MMKISSSAYYRFRRRTLSPHQAERNRLGVLVLSLFKKHKGKIGSRMMVALLRRLGHCIGRTRVRALMREQGLVCSIRKRFRHKSRKSSTVPYANVLLTLGTVTQPDQAWVSDITYVRTRKGWRYLAVVMDATSRRVIGWAFCERMTAQLVLKALASAIARRRPPRGLIIHNDRGSQYTSHAYRDYLNRKHLLGSMSGKGHCYDNAMMERFFGTLKDHLCNGEALLNPQPLHQRLAAWIEVDYNHARSHSAINYWSPAEFEYQLLKYEAAA